MPEVEKYIPSGKRLKFLKNLISPPFAPFMVWCFLSQRQVGVLSLERGREKLDKCRSN
jgi:hypothetical protein